MVLFWLLCGNGFEMCKLAVLDMMARQIHKIFFQVVSIIDTETTAHRSIAPFEEPTYKTCHVTQFFLETCVKPMFHILTEREGIQIPQTFALTQNVNNERTGKQQRSL